MKLSREITKNRIDDYEYYISKNFHMLNNFREYIEKYVHKGDKLYIEGRIRYTSYDDKQGQRRFATEIWADNLEFLGSPKSVATTVNEPLAAPQPDTKTEEGLPF